MFNNHILSSLIQIFIYFLSNLLNKHYRFLFCEYSKVIYQPLPICGIMSPEIQKFKLLSGYSIPLIGLGTYLIDGKNVVPVLDNALTVGYRAFDTAAMYGNEKAIGNALKTLLPKHNLNREDIFIQTKLDPSDHGHNAKEALKVSLNKLSCDYLDLYLIHWPGSYSCSSGSKQNLSLRTASWASLVTAQQEGLVRSLGVSNYTPTHLKQLLDNSYGIKPVLNQMEWHPGCCDHELKELCDKEGILLQAYMPLGGAGNHTLLNSKVVLSIAERLGKTPAQVLLRWCLQQNVAVIPKSRSIEHLKDNININFDIPDSDMLLLNNVDTVRFDWNPYSIL